MSLQVVPSPGVERPRKWQTHEIVKIWGPKSWKFICFHVSRIAPFVNWNWYQHNVFEVYFAPFPRYGSPKFPGLGTFTVRKSTFQGEGVWGEGNFKMQQKIVVILVLSWVFKYDQSVQKVIFEVRDPTRRCFKWGFPGLFLVASWNFQFLDFWHTLYYPRKFFSAVRKDFSPQRLEWLWL